MLYLTSDTTGVVTTTLYENCINTINPYFTWKLTNTETKQSFNFYSEMFSDVPYYYNHFTISVVSIATNQFATGSISGIIYTNRGIYNYEIYEMTKALDLNLNNAIGLVETGILTVNGSSSTYGIDHSSRSIFANKY